MPDDIQGMGHDADEPSPTPGDLAAMLRRFLEAGAQQPDVAEALKAMGVDVSDPRTMSILDAQMRSVFAQGPGGPAPSEVARDVARKVISSGTTNDLVTAAEASAVDDAVRVASMWLGPVTEFDVPVAPATSLSRAEWVEATMPTWERVTAPVANGVVGAIESTVVRQLEKLGELGAAEHVDPMISSMLGGLNPAAMVGQLGPVVRTMSRQMFAMQTGHAVGGLAGDVVTATEVGLPLMPVGVVGVLPNAVAEFAAGLETDPAEVLLYCAVREAARVTLFHGVPWLGPQLLTAVEDYARNISIDTDAIEEAVQGIDPRDPSALHEALGANLFQTTPSPAQVAALARLETLLALAEGWVDVVTEQATSGRLPHAVALSESIRRRRVGGAASKTFAALVGLELRPRRLRDAANLWQALADRGGQKLRDAAWAHPDVAPASADLDDPPGYVARLAKDHDLAASSTADTAATDAPSDFDADLDAFLKDVLGDGDAGGSDATNPPGNG